MIDDWYVFSVILVISFITVLLRTIPFFAMEALSTNRYMRFLSKNMPIGVMILLVLYTLKDEDFSTYPYGLPNIASMLIAVILYWRTNNSLLSIGIGLACYMLIVNNLF